MADLGRAAYGLASGKKNTGNTIIAAGDSITAGNSSGPSNLLGDNTWFSHLILKSGGQLKYIYNAGVGGETSTAILSRVYTDVVRKKPAMCTVLMGTNDALQRIPIATTKANLEKFYTTLLENNITPIAATIIPQYSTSYLTETAQINTVVRELASKYGLTLIDFYKVMVTPESGLLKTEYNYDNTHPNTAGHEYMGSYAWSVLAPILPKTSPRLPYASNDALNLITNGLMINDPDADGIPSGWTSYGAATVTHSLVTDLATMEFGKWARIAKTSTGSRVMELTKSTGFAVGDKLNFVGRVKANAQSGGMTYSVQIMYTGNGSRVAPIYNWTRDLDGQFDIDFVVPAGVTAIKVQVSLADGTGQIDVGQFGLKNLTALGL